MFNARKVLARVSKKGSYAPRDWEEHVGVSYRRNKQNVCFLSTSSLLLSALARQITVSANQLWLEYEIKCGRLVAECAPPNGQILTG